MKRQHTLKTSTRNRTDIPAAAADTGPPASLNIMQFAAARAHELTDALYEMANEGIDNAQRSIGPLRVETLWRRLRPAMEVTATFVRSHPWRSGMIVALIAGAVLIARGPALPAGR